MYLLLIGSLCLFVTIVLFALTAKREDAKTIDNTSKELAQIMFLRQLLKSKDPEEKKIAMRATEQYLKRNGKI